MTNTDTLVSIRTNLRQHLTDILADGAAWQVDGGWHTKTHSITVTRRGVVVVRRFAGKTQEYRADMWLGDLDALIVALIAAPSDADQLELAALDDVPTPLTAAARWVSPRVVANLVTAVALAGVLLAL